MRTGYTYDDEMPQSRGSFQNNERHRRKPFTGKKIGHIGINPETGDIEITPLTDEEKQLENQKEDTP